MITIQYKYLYLEMMSNNKSFIPKRNIVQTLFSILGLNALVFFCLDTFEMQHSDGTHVRIKINWQKNFHM